MAARVAAIFAWAEAEDKEAKDQEQSTPGVHHPRGLHLVPVVGGDHAEGRKGREPSERGHSEPNKKTSAVTPVLLKLSCLSSPATFTQPFNFGQPLRRGVVDLSGLRVHGVVDHLDS